MAEIDAEKVNFSSFEEVIPKGASRVVNPPYVELCIEDGRALGQPWSLFVDLVVYHRALFEAQGKTNAEAQAAVRALYMAALSKLDIDEFEAEMYWETYLDTEWEKENPYDLGDDTPPQAVDEDDGPIEEIDVDDEDGLRAVRRLQERT